MKFKSIQKYSKIFKNIQKYSKIFKISKNQHNFKNNIFDVVDQD
jgi:hypothetical protein